MSMVTSCTHVLSLAAPPAKLPPGALQSGKPAAMALQRKPRPLSVRCARSTENPSRIETSAPVHPKLQHYPMLTKSNYAVWAIKMKAYMCAQGVWDAVEGGTTDVWKDQVALAAIYGGIPEDTLLLLAKKDTAKAVCEALKTMHLGTDRVKEARVQTLKSEFEKIRMNETESIDNFAMRLMTIVNQIQALGDEMEESYVVKKFLQVVPKKFLEIASTIEQFGDFKVITVEEVISCLKAHEKRIQGSSGSEVEARSLKGEGEGSSGGSSSGASGV